MKTNKRLRPVSLWLEELEPRLAPATSLGTIQSFDTTPTGTLPVGWSQWSSTGTNAFAVSSSPAASPPNSLVVNSPTASGLEARSWVNSAQPANVQVNAAVYFNSPIPAEVLARGTGLDTTTPSYYAVSVTQGLNLKLLRVQNGSTTTLGEVKSANWFANQWATVTLFANGNNLRAQVQRSDTGQYLNGSGQWQSGQAWALNLTDTAITTGGEVGLGRLPSYTGKVNFDDFSYGEVTLDSQPPVVTIKAPAAGSTVTGVTPVQVSATDNAGISRVEFYVDNVLRAVDTTAPYTWNFDTTAVANGSHTLMVKVYDTAQNIGQTSATFTTQNDFSPLPVPTIPQHSTNIRLTDLAYNGGSAQLDPSDLALLQNSVDLVIEDTPAYLSQIEAVAPNTPQLLYTNVSSVYKSLLTDWLSYADAHGYSREEAFYHVTQATPFAGAGGSTQPVNWFWGVYVGGTTLTDRSWQAHNSSVAFGGTGQSVYIGYPDKFREINIQLASGASAGWSGGLEYATAVDASGNPTAWAPLTTLTDTTAGLTKSGQITFDPPADWKAASVGGSAPLFYVRVRTLTPGTAPVAQTILGRDYVGANGRS
ncbi:MAG TPA: Ig-like domain-containing protein, partial [Gemmataceae bacterium]|nr:Ig-like domain-containing protein [Gemmataceae bacterium]